MIIKMLQAIEKYPIEFCLGIFATLSSCAVAVFAYDNNLMLILRDQSAHLNFARLLTDSLTPGVSQLGIWPPLLHVIMAPYATINGLYQSGFAGFFSLVPFFVMSVVLFYKLLLRLFNSKFFAVFGVFVYMTNPFVLYYSATPMMEILLMCFVISTAYFCVRWIENNHLYDLILTGICITLACLSRFEGLFLIPVVSSIVLLQLMKKNNSYQKIEATLIVFWYVACAGLLIFLIYDLVYFANPLAFLGVGDSPSWNIDYSNETPVTSAPSSLIVFLHASYYMLSFPIVWLSLFSALFAIILSRTPFKLISVMFILAVPAISVLLKASTWIFVPEFSTLNDFHNVRYALTWIPFAALSLVAFPSSLLKQLATTTIRITVVFFVLTVLTVSSAHFYTQAIENPYLTIRRDRSAIKDTGPSTVALYLRDNYDHGYIFANRFGNDELFRDAKISLSSYIYEANNLYYQEVMDQPWKFARYVIMQNPDSLKFNGSKSQITEKWWGSEEFLTYYETAFEGSDLTVYRVNYGAVYAYALKNGIEPESLPSISQKPQLWKPSKLIVK